jgi:hypothetical protein
MENFTSRYLGILKKAGKFEAITDGAVPIQTIQVEENPRVFKYSRPRLGFDKFDEKEELVEPDIKKMKDSFVAIQELGVDILSLGVKRRWLKRQVVQYKLKLSDAVGPNDNPIKDIPIGHYLEYDRANKRIRLIGPKCRDSETGIIGTTKWLKLR